MENESLRKELESLYKNICRKDFIALDPVQFPRCYTKREDIEIAAFLSAAIAWGRRDLILRSAQKMFALMKPAPYNFVMSGDLKKLKDKNIHRTFFERDLKYFCAGFKHIYTKYAGIENLFISAGAAMPDGSRGKDCGVWEGIALFREEMAAANKGRFSRHIANPGAAGENGSACKKFNLALRWLVRAGPVDLGLWKKIKPKALYIPLDVHVARTARKMGLLKRKSNDKRAVVELTDRLREFCPEDPVKYDFALFGAELR